MKLSTRSRLQPRGGFSLLELLVSIAILGALAALLLPALQASREASRRAVCMHHIRQVALATLGYIDRSRDKLPALWRTDRPAAWENFGWRATILPFLEEQALFDSLDFSISPLDDPHRAAVSQPVGVFLCPSASAAPRVISRLGIPGQLRSDLNLAAHDYSAVYNVLSQSYPVRGVWHGGIELQIPTSFHDFQPDERSARLRTRPGSLRRVPDGLSKSVLLVEQAGKPNGLGTHRDAAEHPPTEGAWASCEYSSFWGDGVNTHNYRDPFGMHQGAMVAFCDGAVLFIAESMPRQIVVALLSCDGNEIVSEEDWR